MAFGGVNVIKSDLSTAGFVPTLWIASQVRPK